jgi:nucleotide-binding universal stress UspA family protein
MFADINMLVCTDFSEAADGAIQAAKKLQARRRGKIHLIHVADIGFYLKHGVYGIKNESVQASFLKELKCDLEERMQDQMQRCQVDAIPHIKIGHGVCEAIISAIREQQIGLVLMGDMGAADNPYFQLGSLTKQMAASCPVPLLVVKDDLQMDKVAGLVDVTETTKEVVLAARELAQALPAKLSLISLWQDLPGLYTGNYQEMIGPLLSTMKIKSEQGMHQIREKIKDFLGPDTKAEVKIETTREKDVALHLAEILHEDSVELAVMKRHQKSPMERFFLGSVTSKLLEIYRGNLLICPPTKE